MNSPNRIGGTFSTYPVTQSPLGQKNTQAQPSQSRTSQFVPA